MKEITFSKINLFVTKVTDPTRIHFCMNVLIRLFLKCSSSMLLLSYFKCFKFLVEVCFEKVLYSLEKLLAWIETNIRKLGIMLFFGPSLSVFLKSQYLRICPFASSEILFTWPEINKTSKNRFLVKSHICPKLGKMGLKYPKIRGVLTILKKFSIRFCFVSLRIKV